MKGVVFVIVVIVFVNSAKAVPVEPKQVNLALETVLRFDDRDRAADLAVIDKVQNVLAKIKNAVQSRSARKSNHDLTFTDFILKAAKILRRYNDDHLEDTYAIIDDESRRYINRESKLQDLFGNGIRRYINDQLDIVKDMPAESLRRHLDKAISALEDKEETESNNDILNVGNTLYIGQSDKFKTALKQLDRLRRSNVVDLSQVLRDTLKSLVFDHYSNLNDNVKGELINIVRHYWRAFENDGKPSKDGDQLYKVVKTLRTSSVTPIPIQHTIGARTHNNNWSPEVRNRYKVSQLSPGVVENRDNRSKKKKEETQTTKNLKAEFDLHYSVGSSSSENSKESKEFSESESHTSEMLTGGLKNFRLRADTSSETSDEESDESEITHKPREIVIQHSNVIDVGLSRKIPGRINVSFVSEGRGKSRRSEISQSGRRHFTVFPATISHEGISIESFGTEDSREQTNMRKSNIINITSLTTLNPSDPSNVKKLIEDIEKQIEDVKEKVKFVKSLNIGANYTKIDSSKIKFKATNSDESSTEGLKSKTSISPNSDSIERENDAFLSEDTIETQTTIETKTEKTSKNIVKFRAGDDTDRTRHSSEEKREINNDSKEIINSTVKTDKVNSTVNNATVNIEDIKLNLNETTDDNKIVNEASDNTESDNKEEIDKEHKNITNVDKTNQLNSSHTTNTTISLDLTTKTFPNVLEAGLVKELNTSI